MITTGIERYQAPLAAWQAELNRLFPKTACLSWLHLDWLSDDMGEEIGRWVIYQMVPAATVLPATMYHLDGPHPDTMGYRKNGQWRSTAPPGVTREKWRLWREYKAEARLFWIIQGSGGGHRYRVIDPIERKLRRMMGLSPDTPAPGDLPYAEFDWRVADNLLDLDDVRKYTRVADLTNRNKDHLTADEQDAGEAARSALLRWWSKQVDGMIDSAGMVGRGGWWARNREHFPYAGEQQFRYEDIEQEQFITDAPVTAA